MKDLWLKWTLNCAFGELTGIAAAGAIAFGINSYVGDPTTTNDKLIVLSAMMFAGLVEGTLLGYFQWRVLVQKFKAIPKREWLSFTILVAVLGWFLGMLPSLFFTPNHLTNSIKEAPSGYSDPILFSLLSIGMGLVLGAFFGLFQYFPLRKYVKNARNWILGNALGWGAGMGWIFLFASIPSETSSLLFTIQMGLLGGLLAGLSVGVITGWFLINFEER